MEVLNNAIQAQEGQAQGQGAQQEGAGEAIVQGMQQEGNNPQMSQEPNPSNQEGQTQGGAQTLDMEQLNAFTNAIIAAQTQREQEIRAQYETQKQQVQEEPLSDELQFIADKLGISSIKEKYEAIKEENDKLRETLNIIQAQSQQTQVKAQVAELESRIEGFSGKEIYGYLVELNKTNPTMAQALDNPQGWEMIHRSLHGLTQGQQAGTQQQGQQGIQQTQPQPDFILNGTQNSKFEPNETMAKIKSGTATYAEMGSIF